MWSKPDIRLAARALRVKVRCRFALQLALSDISSSGLRSTRGLMGPKS